MTEKGIGMEEFRVLDRPYQLELLRRDGVYVGKLKRRGRTVVLYQLHTFYVEIHYADYRREIEDLQVDDGTGILQPYLDQIRIKGLGDDEGPPELPDK